MKVVSQASGSPAFGLGPPGAYAAGDRLLLAGRVCRRARNTRLSPSTVRIERVDASGTVAGHVDAALPPIYRRADQACAPYSRIVSWRLAEGDSLRACFERGAACPATAETRAVVPVPAAAATP